jgi:UDP-glucose 4-epimerase
MAWHPSDAFNLGNGNGFSVREVIEVVERVTGRRVKSTVAPRRPGDPPALVGEELGEGPARPGLESGVR